MERSRWRLTTLYLLVMALLCVAAYGFQRIVREELWNHAMVNMEESTEQGRHVLRVHFEEIETVLNRMKVQAEQLENEEELQALADSMEKTRWSLRIYMRDGDIFPKNAPWDDRVFERLSDRMTCGLIDPHVNSKTGAKVFDMYLPFTLKDGSRGYLVREFPLETVIEHFALSFYDGRGYSYIMNRQGEVLLHDGKHVVSGTIWTYLKEMEDQPEFLSHFRDAVALGNGGSGAVEFQGRPVWLSYRPLDDSSSWYLVSVVPLSVIRDESNHILSAAALMAGMISVCLLALLYITMRHRRRSEQAVAAQKSYSAHIFNHVTEGIGLVEKEPPYRIREINPAGRKILGIAPGISVVGKPFRAIFAPADGTPLTALVKAVLADGEGRHFESEGYGPSGKFVYLSGGLEKHKDSLGQEILIANFHDVTGQKEMEKEKDAEQRKVRRILLTAIGETYPFMAAYDLTANTVEFIWMNGQIKEQHEIGQSVTDLYHWGYDHIDPEHQADFEKYYTREALIKRMDQKRYAWLEYKFRFSNGEWHWLSSVVVRVDDEKSDHVRVVYLASIVDEQKAAEEEQRRLLESSLASAHAANEAKSRFLSNMSHDIRTPMNAIIGMASLLVNEAGNKDKVLEYSDKISSSGKQLLSIINDILDMSKIESGKTVLHLSNFTMEDIGSQVETIFRPLAEQKKQTFTVLVEPTGSKEYEGDKARVLQILNNVVSNAVKYTPEGGRVTLLIRSLRSHPAHYGRFSFRVEDTGIGMSKEFQAHLFDAFSRDEEVVKNIQGTGLGMAITKNLVELMGGNITVESELGKGTSFDVVLDFKAASVSTAAAEEQVPVDEHVLSGMHFLCAEDNELNAEILTELLKAEGATCEIAPDGEKAVARFTHSSPGTYDMILMDVQMPVMNGYEATRAIRASDHKEAKDIPIIAMTANAFAEDIQKSLQSGMNAHVSKPIDMQVVKKAVTMLKACRAKKGGK